MRSHDAADALCLGDDHSVQKSWRLGWLLVPLVSRVIRKSFFANYMLPVKNLPKLRDCWPCRESPIGIGRSRPLTMSLLCRPDSGWPGVTLDHQAWQGRRGNCERWLGIVQWGQSSSSKAWHGPARAATISRRSQLGTWTSCILPSIVASAS